MSYEGYLDNYKGGAVNEVLEQIAKAKQQLYANPGCACEDCALARHTLRRYAMPMDED